jgi:glucosamine-6-phosphate deaminase
MLQSAVCSESNRYLRGTRVPTLLFRTSSDASRHVALMIESLIRQNNSAGRATVLGLATGSTPVGLYRELIKRHREAQLDFSRAVTFNLDEYYPMEPDDVHSYHAWMHVNFFQHVNIRPENIHIPDGTIPADKVDDYCDNYEAMIKRAGGIDIQILGIGRSGHIGFNEPGSMDNSRTRMVSLDSVTRRDAASGFFGIENVPHQALSMGVGTILDARQVVLLAFGEHKAPIIRQAVEQPPTPAVTASFLQRHQDVIFCVDQAAAADMTAVQTPWAVGPVQWNCENIRRAVLWLSLESKKPLLLLTDEDFRNHELYSLLRDHGPAQKLTRRIFDDMATTITYDPGSNFQAGNASIVFASDHIASAPIPVTAATLTAKQPQAATKKNVLVFSPHPDDDVISLGGTLIHLVGHGHTVHVAYMTSGNIAVFDYDALRFADFVAEFNKHVGIDPLKTRQATGRISDLLASKKPGQRDEGEVLYIKGLIRATEARAAALTVGIPAERLHFLDMPFYRTGTIAKLPIGPEDVKVCADLIREQNPAQIYMAGDLSDPHGTHRLCADAILAAVKELSEEGIAPEVWLYRGAWQEWEPHEVDRVIPISPDDMELKKAAIFKHQSQKDRAMFPGGEDEREFWQRAEQRNRHTAAVYDQLGLPQFYALEGLVLWRGEGL